MSVIATILWVIVCYAEHYWVCYFQTHVLTIDYYYSRMATFVYNQLVTICDNHFPDIGNMVFWKIITITTYNNSYSGKLSQALDILSKDLSIVKQIYVYIHSYTLNKIPWYQG